jgi:hypothetical protein
MVVLYLDTNLVIAGIEKTPLTHKLTELQKFAGEKGHELVSSELSLIEALRILRQCEYLRDCIESRLAPMEIEWRPSSMRFTQQMFENASLKLAAWENSNSKKGGVRILPLGDEVGRISRQLAGKTSLHAEDLLHVSTAVYSSFKVYTCPAFFLSSDERLVTSAREDGLSKLIHTVYGTTLRFTLVTKKTGLRSLVREIKP